MCCVLVLLGLGPRQGPSTLIDHHQHFFSEAVTAFTPALPVVTADDLVPLLDAAAISRAVIFSQGYQFGNPNRPPVEDEYAKVRAENDWTSQQIGRYPDRLRGFCGLNPLKDYAVDEGHALREGSAPEIRGQDAQVAHESLSALCRCPGWSRDPRAARAAERVAGGLGAQPRDSPDDG